MHIFFFSISQNFVLHSRFFRIIRFLLILNIKNNRNSNVVEHTILRVLPVFGNFLKNLIFEIKIKLSTFRHNTACSHATNIDISKQNSIDRHVTTRKTVSFTKLLFRFSKFLVFDISNSKVPKFRKAALKSWIWRN